MKVTNTIANKEVEPMLTDIEISQQAQMLNIKEIAQKLGISRSYVSRIETKALEELREYFEVN